MLLLVKLINPFLGNPLIEVEAGVDYKDENDQRDNPARYHDKKTHNKYRFRYLVKNSVHSHRKSKVEHINLAIKFLNDVSYRRHIEIVVDTCVHDFV